MGGSALGPADMAWGMHRHVTRSRLPYESHSLADLELNPTCSHLHD